MKENVGCPINKIKLFIHINLERKFLLYKTT